MGWEPGAVAYPEFLILEYAWRSSGGGWNAHRAGLSHGALGGGLLVSEAARELRNLRAVPFAGACTDPAMVERRVRRGCSTHCRFGTMRRWLRRLMRVTAYAQGCSGWATCDKGLPAMMMALASSGELPSVLIPGGVTLLPDSGEDAGKVQTSGARCAQRADVFGRSSGDGLPGLASPGGGCQFLGTAATSQVVGEALGLSLPHSALAPSGQAVWWMQRHARLARCCVWCRTGLARETC